MIDKKSLLMIHAIASRLGLSVKFGHPFEIAMCSGEKINMNDGSKTAELERRIEALEKFLDLQPRPAPKKTMAIELMETFMTSRRDSSLIVEADWNAVASRAKELVLEGKEKELCEIIDLKTSQLWDTQALVKSILTYLRESCP